MTGEGADRGSHEQLERDEARNRVPRQAEQEDPASIVALGGANRKWLARLDGDTPQVDPADLLEGELDDVVRPDGNAARHDDRVRPIDEGGAQPSVDVLQAIPRDAKRIWVAAGGLDQRHQPG